MPTELSSAASPPRISTRAAGARCGQCSPARSAIAKRGSQPSCCRSDIDSGISGFAALRISRLGVSHPVICLIMFADSAKYVRRRKRSTVSLGDRRFIRMGTDRSATVSGSFPIPAIALGQNTRKSLKVMFAPCPTHRLAIPSRLWPEFSTPRRASAYSLSPANAASLSSKSNVGCCPSILRTSTALLALPVSHGFATNRLRTSSSRVLPHCFSALEMFR